MWHDGKQGKMLVSHDRDKFLWICSIFKRYQAYWRRFKAVQDFKVPQNTSKARSFLGLINYLASFIPDLGTLTDPIRSLTRKGTTWSWGHKQQDAFDSLKDIIAKLIMLSHFSIDRRTSVIIDASPVGLGALLVQHDEKNNTIHPITFVSRTLSAQERKYCQTEKEALSVVWACERLHIYLYGAKFNLFTYHKALENICSP